MIKGKRNQLANVGNKFQTSAKKVLCCCSAGPEMAVNNS